MHWPAQRWRGRALPRLLRRSNGPAPGDATLTTVAPSSLLQPNTRYRLTIGDGLQDIHHNRLGKRIDIDFTTGAVDLRRALGFSVVDSTGQVDRVAALRPAASIN